MNHYNYRVVRYNTNGEISFALHEIYYNDNDEIDAYSVEPVSPSADSINELIKILDLMKDAIFKPHIDYKTLKK